jgi:hypothetical protein
MPDIEQQIQNDGKEALTKISRVKEWRGAAEKRGAVFEAEDEEPQRMV